jgi:cold shock CspA family protein
MTSTASTASSRSIGCVKWFNKKSGYGFIRHGEDDIFVHHSSIQVAKNPYKYLVEGEYVEFTLSKAREGSGHAVIATAVSGIQGGKLMCETHFLRRQQATKEEGVEAASSAESAV